MSHALEQALQRCPSTAALLRRMEEPARAALMRHARLADIAAGSVLFHPGDACSQYMVVLQGAVGVRLLAESGREILLYRVHAGQTCVLTTMALLSGAPYEAQGRADEPVRALALPAAGFEELMEISAAFRRFAFSSLAMRVADLMQLVGQVAFARLDARLAAFLLHHAGADDDTLRMTHQDIAAELGASREAVSRLLKSWERHGWLRLGRGEVRVLNAAALRRWLS